MRKTTWVVVSILFCVFSIQTLASEPIFKSIPRLSNPSLESLAHGFNVILHDDLTAPYNGEWGYVSRTRMSNQRHALIEGVAFFELCTKLGTCPDTIDIALNSENSVEGLVYSAGSFLFQINEDVIFQNKSEVILRKKTFEKLTFLTRQALENKSLMTFLGSHHSDNGREGSFAAFYDKTKGELLIIGSNTRP